MSTLPSMTNGVFTCDLKPGEAVFVIPVDGAEEAPVSELALPENATMVAYFPSCENYQGVAVVNYTEREIPYTRIIEHKHFESFGQAVYDNPKTIISREYSTEWGEGMEPFYPVNDDKTTALYQQYKHLADQETKVIFGGRLAEYKYYDMDKVIEAAMLAFEKENQ